MPRPPAGHVQTVLGTIAPEQMADVRAKHVLCASLRRPEGIRVRVVAAERQVPEAQPVTPTLEDSYTWLLGADARAAH